VGKDFDIYEVIADRMIAEMENGSIPWMKPWLSVTEGAVKYRNGEPYSLLNQLLLGEPGEYLSFKECKERGGKVKKGAKSKMVVFWKFLTYEKKDEGGHIVFDDQGRAQIEMVPYLRYSNVFHIRDCEGIEPKWEKEVKLNDIQPDEKAEAVLTDYLNRSGVGFISEKQNRACYSPVLDRIMLPLRDQFSSTPEYYSTAFHEATHSTGHPLRLCRFAADSSAAAFGSEDYSKEELVAEIGAAALMHEIGLSTAECFRNSTAYVQNWLKALKDDKHMIVSAAGKADKAVRLILNIQTEANDGQMA
jgi:Antirestriction protein